MEEDLITWSKIFNKFEKPHKKNLEILDLLSISKFVNLDESDKKTVSAYTIKQWEDFIDTLKNYSNLNKNDKILEIGCGCGSLLSYFQNFNINGIDFSENAVKVCQENLKGKFIFDDAINLDLHFENNTFDLIISNSVIQYMPSWEILKEIINKSTSLLKKEGKLFLTGLYDIEKKKKYLNFK